MLLTERTVMKKQILNRKYAYIEVTVVFILVIMAVLYFYTTFSQKTAVDQCFSILDDSSGESAGWTFTGL